jgi:hypothetical protein
MPASCSESSAPLTDGGDRGLPLLIARDNGGHGLRRIGQRRHHVLDDVRLEHLEAEHATQYDRDGDQHDDHAFGHGDRLR